MGELIVIDANTGDRVAILDGGTVTSRRTAALSLLAARTLGPEVLDPILMIGAGAQARAHAEAFIAEQGVEQFYLVSRTSARTEELAAHIRSLGARAHVIHSVGELPEPVPVVITATSSYTPVLHQLPLGVEVVCAIGAYTEEMVEVAPDLVSQLAVVVDTLEGAKEEAGDLVTAVAMGGLDWGEVATLEDILTRGARLGSGRPTMFKSVGHAVFDLAAGQLAASRLGGAMRGSR